MGNFFGLDVKDLVELAKTLEEKAKEGEIKTSFEVRSGGCLLYTSDAADE